MMLAAVSLYLFRKSSAPENASVAYGERAGFGVDGDGDVEVAYLAGVFAEVGESAELG